MQGVSNFPANSVSGEIPRRQHFLLGREKGHEQLLIALDSCFIAGEFNLVPFALKSSSSSFYPASLEREDTIAALVRGEDILY